MKNLIESENKKPSLEVGVLRDCDNVSQVSTSGKHKQSGLKIIFGTISDERL